MEKDNTPIEEIKVEIPNCCEEYSEKCCCAGDEFETIVVSNDEAYDNRNTVYYHCDECGDYCQVIDLDTREVLLSRH